MLKIKRSEQLASEFVRAAYSKQLSGDAIAADLKKTGCDSPTVALKAFWNKDAFKLSFVSSTAVKYVISIKGYKKEILSKGEITELVVDLKDTNVMFYDGGQKIPLHVVGYSGNGEESVFDGVMILCEYKFAFSLSENDRKALLDSVVLKAALNPEMDPAVTEIGATLVDGGIRFFDRYNENSPNYPHLFANYRIEGIDALSSREETLNIGMKVKINSFPKMDYGAVCNQNGAYGLNFILTIGDGEESIFFGFQNRERGLYMFLNGAGVPTDMPVKIGETFGFDVTWEKNGAVSFFVNREMIAKFTMPKISRRDFGKSALTVRWARSRYKAESREDSMDVEIRDLGIIYDRTYSRAFDDDLGTIITRGALETIGHGIYKAPEKFNFVPTLLNEKYGTEIPLTYKISDTEIVGENGEITAHAEKSAIVNVKIEGDLGSENLEDVFTFAVKSGKGESKTALVKLDDKDPFVGSGEGFNGVFALCSGFVSVIRDMGEVCPVNRIVLSTITENVGLVNRNHISVFVSNDNVNYEYVKEFSLLHAGKELYIYNLDLNARYIKVHTTTNGLDNVGRIVNDPEQMIRAYFSDEPIIAEGAFEGAREIVLENDRDCPIYDKLFTLSFEELGINTEELREDKADVRFLWGEKWLPQYCHGDSVTVRVFEMKPYEKITVKVLYKNKTAASVSDGNDVFEISYGTKHARANYERGWFNSVATMPNGDILRIVDIPNSNGDGNHHLSMYRSTNGGLTWSGMEDIPGTDMVRQGGGFIVDNKNGKVFYFSYHFKTGVPQLEKRCKYHIFESDDNGYTWSGPMLPIGNELPVPDWAISYSDGITLSCEDGDGPNVDYVFTSGVCRDLATSAYSSSSIYSRDGGKTWIFSDSRAIYEEGFSMRFEGGMSEETVIEQEDGTLVMYSRCQIDEITHFAVTRSDDHGVTWGKPILSNIYTSNTQPIIVRLHGVPVFLWGGNNCIGGVTYLRYPLNMAVSKDDGNSFTDIVDASLCTNVATLNREVGKLLHTNPDMTFGEYKGVDMCYIVSTRHQMYIMDVENYLYKTKGAYDSFESGAAADGWLTTIADDLKVTEKGATEGRYALLIDSNRIASRPLHYMESGRVSFDLYVSDMGEGFGFELQSSFTDMFRHELSASPISVTSDRDGVLRAKCEEGERELGVSLRPGANTVCFSFDGEAKKATLEVNGVSVPVDFLGKEKSVCYATFFTNKNTELSLDRFIAVRDK